ncbi:MAG: hypothetical protein QF378_00960 [Candidatus Poseidoniia archaeon]|nr:hypothetical protein [Candidatus Poseidoniia archaeon]MDP7607093.1 hypothetical protein [Candidatus Poseidoniia archaeon]HJP43734.1 hypothetical protein [Candidatus Poseidoniia archaeon]
MASLWSAGKPGKDDDGEPEDAEIVTEAAEETEATEPIAESGEDADAPDEDAEDAAPEEAEAEPEETSEELDLGGSDTDAIDGEEELDLSSNALQSERDEPVAAPAAFPPLLQRAENLNMRIVGAISAVAILLLTAVAVVMLGGAVEVTVPSERYGDTATYTVTGGVDLTSPVGIPLPFLGEDVEVNDIHVEWGGTLEAGTEELLSLVEDGYGQKHPVFRRYIEQDWDPVSGSVAEEGTTPTDIEHGRVNTTHEQFVREDSLEIIKERVENYAYYEEFAVGEKWSLEKLTSWVPRADEKGMMPHAQLYVGKQLREGDSGSFVSNGLAFSWEALDGGKVDGSATIKLRVSSSSSADLPFNYHYGHTLRYDLWVSERSAYPLKFDITVTSDAASSTGELYSFSGRYSGTINGLTAGYSDVPQADGTSTSGPHIDAELEAWDYYAPAFGNSTSSLDSGFALQDAINDARQELPPSDLDDYLTDYPQAFVTRANYDGVRDEWNLTLAHYDKEKLSGKVTGWELLVNRTNASGREVDVDNPLVNPAELDRPLTVSSAEELLMSRTIIAGWAGNAGVINHAQVNLSMGQNLASRENLFDPLAFLNIDTLTMVKLLGDLASGDFDPDDYGSSVDANGGYGYYIEQVDGSTRHGAAVDASDGLLLFNAEHRASA